MQPVYYLTIQAYLAGAQSTSFTNANVTIVLTPVLTTPDVPTQTFYLAQHSAPLRTVGQLGFTSRLPMNVTWAIVADSSGGLFTASTSGVVSVANVSGVSSSLDFFASPNTFTLAVSATCVAAPSLIGRGTLTVALNETNDAPVLNPASQTILVPELSAINGTVAGALTSSDVNNYGGGPFSSPTYFSLLSNASSAVWCPSGIGGQLTPARPTLALDAASGILSWVNVNTSVLNAWQYIPYFPFGGVFARAVYFACVNVSDGGGAWSIGSATIVVVANIPAVPTLTSISISNATTLNTRGGDTINFVGTNFNPLATITVTGLNPSTSGTLSASSCAVPPGLNNTMLTCVAPPGVGVGIIWTVAFNGIAVASSTPMVLSYTPPVVTGVVGASALPTIGGSTVVFSGDFFGPPGTARE